MRNILRIIFPAVLLMTILSSPALAQQKIATVDMRKLFDGYWKTKQAETALNDRKAELDKEDRGFLDNLQKDRDDYQKLLDAANDQAISSDERDKRKQAAADKNTEIQSSQTAVVQFERQAQATLAAQTQRMRTDIIQEITTVVTTKAKAAGYTMVIDAAAETANATTAVVFSNGQNDLTDAVLKQLNAGAPINTLSTPVSPSPSSLLYGTNQP